MRSNDDRAWMSGVSKEVAEVYRSADALVGRERVDSIRAGLRALETTLA